MKEFIIFVLITWVFRLILDFVAADKHPDKYPLSPFKVVLDIGFILWGLVLIF